MKFLYDRHKGSLPKGSVDKKNVISSEEEGSVESDNPEREVNFF